MNIEPEMFDLVRAFDESRLNAFHIDMQNKFYAPFSAEPTAKAFPIVRDFAQNLRDIGVPNNWVAYNAGQVKTTYGDFRKGRVPNDLRFYPGMGIHDDDLVFIKGEHSAYNTKGPCLLEKHFKASGQDVKIMDGVKDYYCIDASLFQGLIRDFRIYVPLDATNCPENEFENFAQSFRSKIHNLPTQQRANVTFTTTDKILSALRRASGSPNLTPLQQYAA